MKEKRPVEQFLGVNRNQRIENKNKHLNPGRAPNQGKRQLRRQQIDRDPQPHKANSVASQNSWQKRAGVSPRSELREVKRRITPEQKKRQQRGNQQVRNRQVWNPAVVNEQGNDHKYRREFQSEKN